VLSAAPGFHRFVWDLHYERPAGTAGQPGQYPISASPHNTPREPRGPWALPGDFTVRLTVAGKTYRQPLTVKMDPRVKTPPAALAAEHAMAVSLFDAMVADSAIVAQAAALRRSIGMARQNATAARDQQLVTAVGAIEDSLNAIVGQGGGGGRGGRGGGRGATTMRTVTSLSGELLPLMQLLEEADVEPTTQAVAAVRNLQREQAALVARWTAIRTRLVPALNARLRAASAAEIPVP
jgi:hypothetical protein